MSTKVSRDERAKIVQAGALVEIDRPTSALRELALWKASELLKDSDTDIRGTVNTVQET